MTFSRRTPSSTKKFAHAIAAAPAPETTTFMSAELLARELGGVEQRGARDDRGAVLVVVEHRDLHALAQPLFDLEALRRLDVLEVDAAERRLERGDDVDERAVSFASSSRSNTSMSANFLNRQALPSITGLPASGPMLPRPSTAVPLVMTATRLPRAVYSQREVGVGGDLEARLGDAGRVRERQVALADQRLGRDDLDLPWPSRCGDSRARPVCGSFEYGTLTGFHASRDELARAKLALPHAIVAYPIPRIRRYARRRSLARLARTTY